MKKLGLCTLVVAVLSVPISVKAHDATWSMPYFGTCSGPSDCLTIVSTFGGFGNGQLQNAIQARQEGDGSALLGVANNGFGVSGVGLMGGYFSTTTLTGTALRAQSMDGYALHATGSATVIQATSTNGIAVNASGLVGVKASGGGAGVQAIGFVYGIEATGGTAPLFLHAKIPGNGQNPLCKSTSGSSAGSVGYCSSTRAMKENIGDLDMGTETLMRLRPVMFQWKSDHTPDVGFIAEEVAKVNPVLAVYNERGELQSVKYTQLTALLTKVVQEQQRDRQRVEEHLRKQVSELQRQNAEQQRMLAALATRLGALEALSARR